MNIDDMPAGPELDRLVAEKVMGWHLHEHNGLLWKEIPESWGDQLPWEPSTKIAHAWEALQRTNECGQSIGVLPYGKSWAAVWVDVDAKFPEIAHADTAPLAICRAALKAKGAP